MEIKTCTFIKTNGVRCGSPALRGQDNCYFHRDCSEPGPAVGQPDFKIPVLEDAETIQVLLTKIVQGLAAGTIDPARAKSITYALQVASQNLKQTNFRPLKGDVVIDADADALLNRWLKNPKSACPLPSSKPSRATNHNLRGTDALDRASEHSENSA